MAERRKFDDGSSLNGSETDYAKGMRNYGHYSEQPAHWLRGATNKGLTGLEVAGIEQVRMIKRSMRRITRDGRG